MRGFVAACDPPTTRVSRITIGRHGAACRRLSSVIALQPEYLIAAVHKIARPFNSVLVIGIVVLSGSGVHDLVWLITKRLEGL